MARRRERQKMWKEEGELREQNPRANWMGRKAQAPAGGRLLGGGPQTLGHWRRAARGSGGSRQNVRRARVEGLDIVHEVR